MIIITVKLIMVFLVFIVIITNSSKESSDYITRVNGMIQQSYITRFSKAMIKKKSPRTEGEKDKL